MSTKVLKKTTNIELCYGLLKERLYYDAAQKHHVRLQRPTDRAEAGEGYADVAWIQQFGLWMNLPDPWQLNAFGLCDHTPGTWEAQQVLCDFNFHPGRSGAFCRDEYSGILLLHNGDIVGADGANLRDAFWRSYHGPQLTGAEQQEQAFAVVAHLGSIDVARQIKDFIAEVVRIRGG